MEITYVTHNLSVGGSQKVIINLTNEALKRNFKVNIITLVNDNYLFNNIIPSENLNVISCVKGNSSKGILIRLQIGFNLLKIIWKRKPKFIHSHLWQIDIAYLIFIGLFSSTRIIHTIHSPGGAYLRENFIHHINILIERTFIHMFKKNKIIAVSEETNIVIKNILNYNKSHVIPNGIDFDSFQQKNQILNHQLFDLDKKIFVYPARFVTSKGHDLLLTAFSFFSKIHNNTYLLLVGTDLKENLYELVEDLNLIDRVIFYGPSSNINNLLSQCHYGVFPSQYEGHSLALCEMMASGLPIVASDINPVKYITNNGKGALLFKQDSVDDLLLKMVKLFNDKDYALSLSIMGKKIIKEKFSAFQMLDSHLRLYEFSAKVV